MASQDATQVRLLFAGGEALTVHRLPFHIGRRGQSDLVIQDPRVSNTHCALELGEHMGEVCLFIRDLRSRNGTMLQRGAQELIIHGEPTQVHEGDLILLGDRNGEVQLEVAQITLAKGQSSSATLIIDQARPPEQPTLLVEAAPPEEDATPRDPFELLRLARELSSELEPEGVTRVALSGLHALLQRPTALSFYPLAPPQIGHEPRLEAPVFLEGQGAGELDVDPKQVELALKLNKLTPFHPKQDDQSAVSGGLIVPVTFNGLGCGALVLACAHPPISGEERAQLKALSDLLGARLHSARYYLALRRSAEELVLNFEALQRTHRATLKRLTELVEGDLGGDA